MLGRLLNSLSYRLRHELRAWRKANQTIKENVWPWYQRVLIVAGKHPAGVPCGLLMVVLLLSAVSWWSYHTFCESPTCSLSVLPTVSKHHFPSLWATQAAIVAMIYPIVIGFVTLLLQRRHSAKASLQIYLHDSAAIVTGLSALFLVTAMSVQFFFIEMIEESVLAVWLILDGAWFLINILGVIRFLYRTFDFLRTDKRTNIVRTYAINYIWPTEVHRNLEHYRFHEAVDSGLLPGPNFGDRESTFDTATLIHLAGQDMGDVQVSEQKKDNWFIRDVRFHPLSRAMKSWQRREERLAQSQDGRPDALAGLHHSRLFILPSAPGTQFNALYGLARTEGGKGLTRCEKWLVRKSFVLRPKKQLKSPLSVSEILGDLVAGALVAMEANEEVAFREALDELMDLHCSLIQAGNFVISDGTRDNYANLVDCNDVFERRMHVLWILEYQRLLKKAVERLLVSNTYFGYLAYLPNRLMSKLGVVRPTTISGNFLGLSRYLHDHLNRWWSRTVEAQGSLSHGPCEPVILQAPAFALYESAIKKFVGAWESLKNEHFTPKHDKETITWSHLEEISKLYTEHLDDTVLMLFENLFLGNKVGAEWLCDLLVKWCNMLRYELTDNWDYYIRDERKLTLELMQKPWKEAKKVIDLSMPDVDESDAPKSLWAACIKNYWIDLCCLSLYAMIQLGKDCECEKSVSALLAGNLGKGTPLQEGGNTIGEQWPIQGPEDLLIAILRQFHFDGGYRRGYRARLDRMVEQISYLSKPAMVSGRVYTNWGLEDLDTLLDGQLILLCLLIKKDWVLSPGFIETIQKWGGEDYDALQNFADQLGQWKTRLNGPDFQEYGRFFACAHAKFGAVDKLEDAIAALNSGMAELITNIEGFQNDQLQDAQVSENRLKEVAEWGSRSGFSKESGRVPVSLFRKVVRSREPYDEHSLSIQKVNKGEFVEPRMARQVSNEEEYFDRTVRSQVAVSVMAKILSSLNPKAINVDSPVTYWKQIQNAASRIRKTGGTPVLFIAARDEPRWLLDWARSYYDEGIERPEGLQWTRNKRLDSVGHVGSLNEIPAYVTPIGVGSSYVISQEVLDVLRVTEFEDDVFVRASYEQVQGNDMLINLKLTWRFQLELGAGECWQLRYIQSH